MHAMAALARSPVTLSAYSEDKARVAAPFLQLVCVGDVEAHLCGAARRNAQLVSGAIFLRRSFNGQQGTPVSAAR